MAQLSCLGSIKQTTFILALVNAQSLQDFGAVVVFNAQGQDFANNVYHLTLKGMLQPYKLPKRIRRFNLNMENVVILSMQGSTAVPLNVTCHALLIS
jgi:hypothetical protein